MVVHRFFLLADLYRAITEPERSNDLHSRLCIFYDPSAQLRKRLEPPVAPVRLPAADPAEFSDDLGGSGDVYCAGKDAVKKYTSTQLMSK